MFLPLNPPVSAPVCFLPATNAGFIIFERGFLNAISVQRAVCLGDGRHGCQRSVQPGRSWVNAPADSCDTAP